MISFIHGFLDRFPPVLLANLAILFTMLVWGTSFISTKIALAEIPPFTIAFCRFLITAIFLWLLVRKTTCHTKTTIRNHCKIALTGFIGITVYFCFENIGINLTTAANASLITSISPILAITLNLVIFKARLSVLEILGVAIGMIGAYLIVTAHGSLDFTSSHFMGNLYMIGAMIAWSVYTILSKYLQNIHSGIYLITWQTIYATIFLLPFALWEHDQWQTVSYLSLIQIGYLALVCSGLGYFLYIYALKALDVAITTLYLNLIPIIGVISGYCILGEQVLPIQLLGGLIILGAIFIANAANILNLCRKPSCTRKA